MLRRNITRAIKEALSDTPVVALVGARQTGKTTLVRQLSTGATEKKSSRYFTLDDAATLAAVTADPASFVRQLDGLLIIDEVQRAPELLPALKVEIDRDRRPGRCLLTGSANVLLLPKVSESLAGRMEVLRLHPFSQGELAEHRDCLIDRLLSDSFKPEAIPRDEVIQLPQRVLVGGFPEAIQRQTSSRRDAWFASYVSTILYRDVRDLANVEGLTQMPRLLALLAARSASLLNKAELSRATGLAYTTLDRYLALLEMTFLLDPLPPWSINTSKRLVRSPKTFLNDSGLAAHLVGFGSEQWQANSQYRGGLVETFVVSELRKQASWSQSAVSLFHFRSHRQEVDVVLEDRAGSIVGIEVKAGASLGRRDTAGLRALAEIAGDQFVRGVVLYGGEETLPLGPDLWAMPIASLWR